MTYPTPAPATLAGGTGQPDLPFPPAPIEELLRLLVKAVRAHQLYLPNNPVYRAAIDAVRAAFAPIWKQTDEFSLKFTETEVRWFDHPVFVEPTKGADSLPWTFFKDGVREIQLAQGFETDELVKLLDILQRVRKTSPEEDDLLTMLWESDFANLRYRYVDLGAEPVAALEDGSQPLDQPSADGVYSAAREGGGGSGGTDQSRAAVVNMQDFDATLYFLDEKELDYLRREVEREYQSDLRQNVLSMLFDIYETHSDPGIRDEVTDLVENVMLLLLSAGQLRTVAYLLVESQIAVQRASNATAAQQERLGRLSERLSMPEPLGQMLQALDESADLPPQAELTELFEQLRPSALGTIFAWLPRLQNAKIRPLVEHAANRLAGANTSELVKLILSADRNVAAEAIRRAGAMKASAGAAPMAKVLHDGEVSLRQLAVQALTEIGSAGALQALERSIDDPDRAIRVAAVRALGAKAYRGVFGRLEPLVKGKALRQRDLTERMAFFEAYGAMCGDNGVLYLDGILNGKGMFGKREEPELRACAAVALGRVGTAKAKECLQRASGEKDIVVRNAVARALRGGGLA